MLTVPAWTSAPGAHVDRPRLAGEQAEVDRGVPRGDDPVDGDRLADQHREPVARDDRVDRHDSWCRSDRSGARDSASARASSSAAVEARRWWRSTIQRATSSRNTSIASAVEVDLADAADHVRRAPAEPGEDADRERQIEVQPAGAQRSERGAEDRGRGEAERGQRRPASTPTGRTRCRRSTCRRTGRRTARSRAASGCRAAAPATPSLTSSARSSRRRCASRSRPRYGWADVADPIEVTSRSRTSEVAAGSHVTSARPRPKSTRTSTTPGTQRGVRLDEPHARGAPQVLEVERGARAAVRRVAHVDALERRIVELGVAAASVAFAGAAGLAQRVELLEPVRGDRARARSRTRRSRRALAGLPAGRDRQAAVRARLAVHDRRAHDAPRWHVVTVRHATSGTPASSQRIDERGEPERDQHDAVIDRQPRAQARERPARRTPSTPIIAGTVPSQNATITAAPRPTGCAVPRGDDDERPQPAARQEAGEHADQRGARRRSPTAQLDEPALEQRRPARGTPARASRAATAIA